jgi:hypothetical protein
VWIDHLEEEATLVSEQLGVYNQKVGNVVSIDVHIILPVTLGFD